MPKLFKKVSCQLASLRGRSGLSVVSCRKGFTLIELLVVIVIISILATLLMVNFVGVRQRGRDAQRKSDIRQIQSALELFRADNGDYPDDAALGTCGPLVSFASGNATYLKKVPCDPTRTTTPYSYAHTGAGTYTLYACLENANDINKDASFNTGCNTISTASYTVNAP